SRALLLVLTLCDRHFMRLMTAAGRLRSTAESGISGPGQPAIGLRAATTMPHSGAAGFRLDRVRCVRPVDPQQRRAAGGGPCRQIVGVAAGRWPTAERVAFHGLA